MSTTNQKELEQPQYRYSKRKALWWPPDLLWLLLYTSSNPPIFIWLAHNRALPSSGCSLVVPRHRTLFRGYGPGQWNTLLEGLRLWILLKEISKHTESFKLHIQLFDLYFYFFIHWLFNSWSLHFIIYLFLVKHFLLRLFVWNVLYSPYTVYQVD